MGAVTVAAWRGQQIFESWNYRRLSAFMWTLGITFSSQQEWPVLLATEAFIAPAPARDFVYMGWECGSIRRELGSRLLCISAIHSGVCL